MFNKSCHTAQDWVHAHVHSTPAAFCHGCCMSRSILPYAHSSCCTTWLCAALSVSHSSRGAAGFSTLWIFLMPCACRAPSQQSTETLIKVTKSLVFSPSLKQTERQIVRLKRGKPRIKSCSHSPAPPLCCSQKLQTSSNWPLSQNQALALYHPLHDMGTHRSPGVRTTPADLLDSLSFAATQTLLGLWSQRPAAACNQYAAAALLPGAPDLRTISRTQQLHSSHMVGCLFRSNDMWRHPQSAATLT